MKKNQVSISKMAMSITIVAAFACCLAWIKPPQPMPGKGKDKATGTTASSVQNTVQTTVVTEEMQLVQRMESDGLISQVNGFIVEKKKNLLFINGKQLPANIAGKYTASVRKEDMTVQLYPFMERLRQHPNSGFIQVLMPVMFSSPCVDTKPKKPGC